MHSLFKTQDYASVPAFTLPNIGLNILEAETRAIQKKQSSLPFRHSSPQQNECTPVRKNNRNGRKRSASTGISLKEKNISKTHRNVASTDLPSIDLFTDSHDVALTYDEADTLSWMLGVLKKGTDPWARTFSAQIPELLQSVAVSPTPTTGAPAKIKATLQNGFIFGKFVELLECISIPGLSDQCTPAVAYNNWTRALSVLRTNVLVSPTHLFIERDLARAGPDFLHMFLLLLKDLKQAYNKPLSPSPPNQTEDVPLVNHSNRVLFSDNMNFTLQANEEQQQDAYPDWKLCAPHSHTLQELRSDMFISYPIEHTLYKTEVSQWLEWLSLEPPLFAHDKLISNPWCNGYNFHLILSKIYSILVADTRSLVLPIPNPSSCEHCAQNNSFILQFAEHCGISCAYRILAGDFTEPSQCENTVWALLSSIVQRFPLPDTLASKELDYPISAALLPYNPLQFSMLEKSLCHWIFTLGFLAEPPYNCDNIPAFPVLIPHIKTGCLFRDLSLTALRLGIFTQIPLRVNYNSLQHHGQNRGGSSQYNAFRSSNTKCQHTGRDITIGLQLFATQKDTEKTLLEEVCQTQFPAQFLSNLTKFQLVLLVEDIHRCWDRIPPRSIHPEPYTPYAPLSFKMDKTDITAPPLVPEKTSGIEAHSKEECPSFSSTSKGNLWKMEASFVRPPDEILVETRKIIPSLWFLPEIRGYPMNYNSENEIVPLFTPLLHIVKPQ